MTTVIVDKIYRSKRCASKKLHIINKGGYGHGHRSNEKSGKKEKKFYETLEKALASKLIFENKYDCQLFIYPVYMKVIYQVKGGTQHEPNTDSVWTYGYFLTRKRKKDHFKLTDS